MDDCSREFEAYCEENLVGENAYLENEGCHPILRHVRLPALQEGQDRHERNNHVIDYSIQTYFKFSSNY